MDSPTLPLRNPEHCTMCGHSIPAASLASVVGDAFAHPGPCTTAWYATMERLLADEQATPPGRVWSLPLD